MTTLPKFITFTGADDATSIKGMCELSAQYPIEWGILFSPNKVGQARYPTLDWLKWLTAASGLKLSAHLCGDYAQLVLAGNGCPFDEPIAAHFDRAQINTADPVNLDLVGKWADRVDVAPILQCRGAFPAANEVLWLFDASGGRGIQPAAWPRPRAIRHGLPVGYAGGLSPANVAAAVAEIGGTAHEYWIDMETGVRDSRDRFDLNACRAVCQAVYGAGIEAVTLKGNVTPDGAVLAAHSFAGIPASSDDDGQRPTVPTERLNAAIRAEIVELWTCIGRPQLAAAAKTDDLVSAVGAIFAEISTLDGLLGTVGKAEGLAERIEELERELAAGAKPYEDTIARLNARITEMNEAALARSSA